MVLDRLWRDVRHSCAIVLGVALLGTSATPNAQAQAFDHSGFDSLLRLHVTSDGLVDYDGFSRAPRFRAYLDALNSADLARLTSDERLALWINAYNAYTIALLNKHDERRSIRNINRTFGLIRGKGPWSEPIARVAGSNLTLDQIEHEIIRERFAEPRIHFALVCAALGCPPLRREAYTGAKLERQLDAQAEIFLLRSPTTNRIDLLRGTAYLSPIFDWFAEDFGAGEREIFSYLAGFFPAGPERSALRRGELSLEYTHYDWTLNSVENGR